jgi:hypothetical protein
MNVDTSSHTFGEISTLYLHLTYFFHRELRDQTQKEAENATRGETKSDDQLTASNTGSRRPLEVRPRAGSQVIAQNSGGNKEENTENEKKTRPEEGEDEG